MMLLDMACATIWAIAQKQLGGGCNAQRRNSGSRRSVSNRWAAWCHPGERRRL